MRAVRLVTILLFAACPAAEAPTPTAPASCAFRVESSVEPLQLPLGRRQAFVVRFSNPSPDPVVLTDLELSGDPAFELLGGTQPQPIAGGSCTDPGVYELPMAFAPKALAVQNALLKGQIGSEFFVLPLRGTGLGPRFEVSTPVSYGIVALGESMSRTLVLRNTGTTDTRASVEVVRVLPGNADTRADELCLGQWNGSTCETPRVVVERQLELPVLLRVTTPGAREWVVTLRSSEFGQPVKEVRLSAFFIDTRGCHLVSSTPVVEFTPPMEFKTLRLENRGTADCLVESFALTNASFRFSSPPPFRRRLLPGEVQDLPLTGFLRSVDDAVEGELTATLLGGMPPPVKVPLRFRVSPLAGCLRFVTPDLDFGPWVSGCFGGTREFLTRNECASPVLVREARATGGFIVVPGLSRGVIPPAATLPVRVQASPGVPEGVASGTVEVEGAGGVVAASIRGEARPRQRTDVFTLDRALPVDVLFILDDSPSFSVHQARTEAALAGLASRVSAAFIDFRFGVTTATRTPAAGRLRALPDGRRWTDWRSSSPPADLVALAAPRDGGSEDESCLEAAIRARTAPLTDDPQGTQGFWRPNTPASIVCISDADDGTGDFDGGIARLRATVDGGFLNFSAVTGLATSPCPIEAVGTRHLAAAQALSGLHADVCDPMWWQQFTPSNPQLPQTVFWLNATPDVVAAQPVVRIDGAVLPQRSADGGVLWSLEPGNLLRLDRSVVEARPETISVTYLPTCQ